jgi:hypothetical protein
MLVIIEDRQSIPIKSDCRESPPASLMSSRSRFATTSPSLVRQRSRYFWRSPGLWQKIDWNEHAPQPLTLPAVKPSTMYFCR